MGDTLALQAEVARAIADGVSAVLTPAERHRLSQARPTSPAANEAYYQGLHYLSQSVRRRASCRRGVPPRDRARSRSCRCARRSRAGSADAGVPWRLDAPGGDERWRSPRSIAPWRSIGLERSARCAGGPAVSTTTGTGPGADRILPARNRAQHEFCQRPLAVCALSGRGRPQGRVHRRGGAGRRARSHVGQRRLDAGADALLRARLSTARSGAIGHALQLEPASASAYLVLSRIHAARGSFDDAIVANERALAIAGDGASNGWRVHLILLQALVRIGATRPAPRSPRLPGRVVVEEPARRLDAAGVRARGPRRPRPRDGTARAGPRASASPTSCGWRSTRGPIRSAPICGSSRWWQGSVFPGKSVPFCLTHC